MHKKNEGDVDIFCKESVDIFFRNDKIVVSGKFNKFVKKIENKRKLTLKP